MRSELLKRDLGAIGEEQDVPILVTHGCEECDINEQGTKEDGPRWMADEISISPSHGEDAKDGNEGRWDENFEDFMGEGLK